MASAGPADAASAAPDVERGTSLARHRRTTERSRRVLTVVSIGLATASAATLGSGGVALAVPGSGAASTSSDSPPCSPAAKACVRLSTHQAWLADGARATYGPVAMNDGGEGYETPTGTFTVQWKDKDHRSSEFNNAAMPYSVFFDGNGRAFHGGDIARQSAGCVRLPTDAARRFFEVLQPGDRVEILR